MAYTGEKQRIYQRDRVRARRKAWVDENGPCKRCGSTDNLEIDHVDRATKKYTISQIWQRSSLLAEELPKCQVLCRECHFEKTKKELGWDNPAHGYSGYQNRGCRCDTCKRGKLIQQRAQRARKKQRLQEEIYE